MILGFSPYFICVLCRVKILPQIYTRIIASLKPPPIYVHYTREKFRPDIYENCGAFGICGRLIERWYLGVRLYHVLYMRSSFEECRFFVDWLMSKFGCKSVMGLHKFIVKNVIMYMCMYMVFVMILLSWFGSHQVVVESMDSDWCSLEVGLMDSCSCICICLL